MASGAPVPHRWSDDLAWALLDPVPDEALAEEWGPGGAAADPRGELVAWARQDEEARRWLMRAWRLANPEVAAAAEQAWTEGAAAACARLCEAFDGEDVLLALLTDEFDDGWELAAAFVDGVAGDGRRLALRAALRHLAGAPCAAVRRPRVVILGGHPRDESRLARRLFGAGPLEVRWRTFEKKQSGSRQKLVAGALRHADAAVLVTGMASHVLMYLVKEWAVCCGVPWRCVTKATDKQLLAALRELFPGVEL